jgi:HSP20 family protein
MGIIRWDPFRELEEVSDRLNRLFSHSLMRKGGEEALVNTEWAPVVDIQETEKEYLVKAELPELKKEDVKVFVEHGTLYLEGERKQEKEEKNKKFHRIERSYGRFVRRFEMPENVDESHVAADFKEGVLNVHLPKSEKAKPKAIEVRVG